MILNNSSKKLHTNTPPGGDIKYLDFDFGKHLGFEESLMTYSSASTSRCV